MLKLVSGDGGRRPGPTRGRNHPPPRLTVPLTGTRSTPSDFSYT